MVKQKTELCIKIIPPINTKLGQKKWETPGQLVFIS